MEGSTRTFSHFHLIERERERDVLLALAVAESTTAPAETDEPSIEEEGEEEGEGEESSPNASARPRRGVARKNARRARGRRGAAARARVLSTKIRGTRRQAQPTTTTTTTDNDATLEETVTTEPEESPKKSAPVTPEVKETRSKKTPVKEQKKDDDDPPATTEPATTTSASTVRVSGRISSSPSSPDRHEMSIRLARIKERASTGRHRPFPYADDYVDLDDLEKQSKATSSKAASTPNRKSAARERTSKSPAKARGASGRDQPVEETKEEKVDVYDQMDTIPQIDTSSNPRKRKSVGTPVASAAANKRK